ncbi:hypothetical protein [Saccharibacillus alkalitolerans]|uniref:Oxidoreductase n=1 Tax=Saccharibacillus alkalitolerans TaxID=2705290 RepID=A0ABX0F0A7_9BACL|nr:hypothetical protein [Saccharibacillus alkalitolerans]NGZ74437.1 hypothetical protein [Saccharibacillus alkalitolerans]
MTVVSVLGLRRQTRIGFPCTFDHAEFLIDGEPLYPKIRQLYPNLDEIGCLGWGPETLQQTRIDRLLLTGDADFPDDRRSLYLCPACGDLGCGAVSIRIERADGRFVWSAFAEESADGSQAAPTPLPGIGPFYFEEDAYMKTIRSAYGLGGFHWPNQAERETPGESGERED